MSNKIVFERAMIGIRRADIGDYKIYKKYYEGTSKKCKIKHNVCGHKFFMIFKDFRKGYNCPKCAQLQRNLSNIKKISENSKKVLFERGFEIVKYMGITIKSEIKHLKCEGIFKMTITELLKSYKCPSCEVEKVLKINKRISEYDSQLLEKECKIIPEYFHSTVKKSKYQCLKCGDIFNGYYFNIIRGNNNTCKCNIRSFKSFKFYKNKLIKMGLSNSYKMLKKTFINSKTKMTFIHLECGNRFYKSPTDFFSNNQKCPECSQKNKGSYSYIDAELILSNRGFKLLSPVYKNSHDPLEIQCNECLRVYNKTLNNIKNNNSTCICKLERISSIGELKIENFLLKNKIKFTLQKTFKKCKYKSQLKFDFYLPEYKLAIEFDGIQHFKPVDYFGGVDYFKECIKRDLYKNKYCEENLIRLVRISYKDLKNIDIILKKNV